MAFDVVVAADEAGGIGRNGELPWRLKGDMKYFRKLTSATDDGTRNAVIMGRKTWDSIPERFRPLERRINIVLTRNATLELPAGVIRALSFAAALNSAYESADVGKVFVIGGANLYAQALTHADCRRVYLTRVAARFQCDTFLPSLDGRFELVSASEPRQDAGIQYDFSVFESVDARAGRQSEGP